MCAKKEFIFRSNPLSWLVPNAVINILQDSSSGERSGTASIYFIHVNGYYGGMNLFVQQISRWLVDPGYRGIYKLRPEIDVVLIVCP